jgi:hypothetical protein
MRRRANHQNGLERQAGDDATAWAAHSQPQPSPPAEPAMAPADPLRQILRNLDDLGASVRYLAEVELDLIRARGRRLVLWAAAAMAGLALALAVVGTSAALMVIGTADGVTLLVGNRAWLGYLVTGLAGLCAAGAALAVPVLRRRSRRLRKRKRRYESRKARRKAI